MASSSPVPGNQSVGKIPQQKTSGRGLNKPKCSKCGNVARSRCPYQCCKSCCSKAQNPCTIHVLRPNANFSDKVPASTFTLFGQGLTNVPSLSSSKIATVRHNNLSLDHANVPYRARKLLTRKESAAINAWRFAKLKEHNEQNIKVENEAFDRYMQNVSLLEEAFGINSPMEVLASEGEPVLPARSPDYIGWNRTISRLKARLRSKPERVDRHRERIQGMVIAALEDLQKIETDRKNFNHVDPLTSCSEKEPENVNSEYRDQYEKLLATRHLLEKMAKVQNKEDLKNCTRMKSQLFLQSTLMDASHGTQETIFRHEISEDALGKVNGALLSAMDIGEL